ncbi:MULTISPECIES: hypothetical protein [unclassified Microbispora]|nr:MULTISPECIES: hypothetical protein [unclassified Microbispora]
MTPQEQNQTQPEEAAEPAAAEIAIRRLDKIETTAFSQGNST